MSLLDLLIALLLSRILTVLLENVGIASIVAYIISGYILSKSVLGVLNDIDTTLLTLSLITLFFYVGLNVDLRISRSVAKKSLVMSSSGVLTTIALVGLTTYLITNDLTTSLIAGIALSNTATEVILLVISSRELSNELFREVLITSSFIDDLLVLFLVATLGLLKDGVPVIPYLIKHVVFALVIISLGYVISKLLSSKLLSPRVIINIAMLMLFSTTLTAYLLGVDLAFTAYFTGISLGILRFSRDPMLVNIVRLNDLVSYLSEVLDMILIPIFFLYVGINMNLNYVVSYSFVVILTSAFLGKFIGCSLPYVVWGESFKGLVYGILMNARGSLESVAAVLALNYGLIRGDIYSIIITTSITSSLTVSLIVRLLRRYLRSI